MENKATSSKETNQAKVKTNKAEMEISPFSNCGKKTVISELAGALQSTVKISEAGIEDGGTEIVKYVNERGGGDNETPKSRKNAARSQ